MVIVVGLIGLVLGLAASSFSQSLYELSLCLSVSRVWVLWVESCVNA